MSRKRRGRGQGFKNNPILVEQAEWQSIFENVLTEIAANRFLWVGMPDSIDTRFLEMTLLNNALSIFYYDKEFSRYFALRGSGVGKINMYDNPTEFRVIGNTMVNKTLGPKECVPIWSNSRRTPETPIIDAFSGLLAETQQTATINIRAMRHTKLVAANENTRLSTDNVNRAINAGEPEVWLYDDIGNPTNAGIGVFDLGIDKEQVLSVGLMWARFWNQAMTLLGVNNANQEKRERMVVEEVSANDEQIYSVRQSALRARQTACEQINAMYDLEVSVKWNADVEIHARDMMLGLSPEGGA